MVKRPSRLGRNMDQDISKRPCSTTVNLTTPGRARLLLIRLLDMPICDGVEAARRIRAAEVERGYDVILPSKHGSCETFMIFTFTPFV